MRAIVALTAAAAAATIMAASSSAGTATGFKRFHWDRMTLTERISAQRQLVATDRRVLATWDSRRWHEQLRRDVNGVAYTTGWISDVDLRAPPPSWVTVRRAHMRWTSRELAESLRLQRRRATVPVVGDWYLATRIADRYYPGAQRWLWSCSAGEGGHGPWVWYGHLSTPIWGPETTPGGWLQYHHRTWTGHYAAAVDNLRSRGIVVPAATASYWSPVGQALAGAYAWSRGQTGPWTGSGCN